VLSLRNPQSGAFAGRLNYRNVIGNGQFWSAVERMGYFGLVQVTFMILLAIGLALFLDSRNDARRHLGVDGVQHDHPAHEPH
jgi:ABC-type sugar transport system permease subunit